MAEKTMPNWLSEKYLVLRENFRDQEFETQDAVDILKETKQLDNEKTITTIFSELKSFDIIDTRPHPEDSRKVLYKLKPLIDLKKVTKDEIIVTLKKSADIIRTRVSYEFLLILLFLKRLSDKWEYEYEEAVEMLKKKGLSEKEAKEEAKDDAYHHGMEFPEEFLWDNIRKDTAKLPERLSKAMKVLAEKNPDLKDIFERGDFVQFASNPESKEILQQLMEVFSEKKLYSVSPDVLGDAYEWILSYFAPQKAKEGEVYTPREVIKLLVNILEPKPEESVYDPSVGSGGMLINAYNYVKDEFGKDEAKKLFLFGQEVNPLSIAICKMNLIIHGIDDARIEGGDSLLYPKFKDDGKLKKFDMVIANPPWNQDGYHEETIKQGELWKQRFTYGFSYKSSADWTWIQHMLSSANDKGKVGVVIDNGCLFRSHKERKIRSEILEDDLIECVIILPEKLFYNTGAPGAVIVLNKNKPKKRKGKVLFINASEEFEQHPDVRRLNTLSEENIEKIDKSYQDFKEVEGFSRVVDLNEIKEYDYNLNVTLYVFPEEEIEEIDVKKEWDEKKELDKKIEKIDKRIEGYLKEVK